MNSIRGPKKKPLMERLTAHSKWNGECLEWTGHIDAFGYGRVAFNGGATRAHRAAWIAHNGTIPNRMFVCHRCAQ